MIAENPDRVVVAKEEPASRLGGVRLDMTSVMRQAIRSNRQITALITEDRALSYAEAWDRGVRLANALHALGEQAGDRVAGLEANNLGCADLHLGCAIGAVRVPLYPRNSREAHRSMLEGTGCRVVITDQVFGVCGFAPDFPAEKVYREAKITEIYEGTRRSSASSSMATSSGWSTDVALFRFPATEVVHYGAGCVSDLSAVVDRLGGKRAFAVASRWLPDLDEKLDGLLGTRYAGSFTGAAAHVPRASVLAAAAAARAAGADLIISMGGGSQIDCTSALVLALAYDITDAGEFDAHRARFTYPSDLKIPPVDRRLMPHVAIPTTLSGAESTNVFGVTDPDRRVKDLFIDAQFAASVVLFDPEITRSVPAWLWAASGMRAVDHAVEGILSPRHMPMADALGLEGLRILRTHLVASAQDPDDLEWRLRCQLGAWLCIYALTNVGAGLSHGLGHQIGARFGTLHGVTSACMLPHVMAFNEDVTGPELARVAEAFAAPDAIEGVHDFIASLEPLGVPHTLQQAGGRWEELAAIAQDSLTDPAAAANPKPVTHADLIGLLEAAWS